MGNNSLGKYFTITSFGESHGKVMGVVIDGVPAGLEIKVDFINEELRKRRPGQSIYTTPRQEEDKVEILSGLFNGYSTGAPICAIIKNKNVDSSKYEKFKDLPRPSHADYPSYIKYGGLSDYRGSGRFSGRITAGYVIAGAIAKLILSKYNIEIFAYTKKIGNIEDSNQYDFNEIKKYSKIREKSPVRTLDHEISQKMIKLLKDVKKEGDSLGGIIKSIVKGIPIGIGNPVFNNLESSISKGIFSIPAIKGIEFGAGFRASSMRGSQHNDPWTIRNDEIKPEKNDSGGIIGGISTGMPIEFNVAIKPTPTISKPQKTVNVKTKKKETISFEGRHDPCIVPRAIVVVEAITAIVFLDHLLLEGKIPNVLKT